MMHAVDRWLYFSDPSPPPSARSSPYQGAAGLTARKLRAQQNARTAAEAEAKSAASAPKHPQGAWSNAAAAATSGGDGAAADGGSAGGAAAEVAPLPVRAPSGPVAPSS